MSTQTTFDTNNAEILPENTCADIENNSSTKKNFDKKKFLEEFLYYSVAPIISLLFFTVFLIFLGIYPYGDRIMSSYDMLAQIAPFGEHFFDVFEGKSSLFFSFSIAGGADTFGTLAYCFISPFHFLFLVGGKGMVNYMVPFVMGGKIVAISLSATFFIKKCFPKISPIMRAILAVLYTYSGYFHVANTYINWLDFLIYLPLAVVAFRRFIQTGKYILFSVSISAMIYACFSIACFSLLIIYLILFAYVYLCIEKQQRRETITKLCLSLILSIAFALPIIVPALFAYINSGRNTGLFDNLNNNLDYLHLYRKISYVLCDVTFFILGLYYFIICNKKEGINKLLIVATVLIFAPVLVDEICLLLNAGSYMSYALRFGFLNSILGLYLSCKVLENNEEQKLEKKYKTFVSIGIGVVITIVCALTIYVLQDIINNGEKSFVFNWSLLKKDSILYKMFEESEFASGYSSKFSHSLGGLEILCFFFGAFAIGTLAILLLNVFKFMPTRIFACVLIILSLMQVGFNSFHMVAGNNNTMITYDQIQVALDDVEKNEGDFTQFRIKDYDDRISADAPLTLHYRSFSVFSSVINGKNFVPTTFFGYTGNGINSMKSRGGDVFSDSLLGYKYAFSKNTSLGSNNWNKIGDYKPFYLFQNEDVFPTAFKIPGGEYSITDGNYADQLNSLYNWLGGNGDLCVQVKPTTIEYVNNEYYKVVLKSKSNTSGNVYILGNLPEGITARYSNGSAYNTETNYDVTNNLKLNKGYRQGSTQYTISIKATQGELTEEIIENSFVIATVSHQKVKELSELAWANAVEVDFGASTISAKTVANSGEKLFINYIAIDGYVCKVNGINTKLLDNDLGFISFDLKPGENNIKLKYSSPFVKFILIGIALAIALSYGVIMAFKHYDKIKKWLERIADLGADVLATVIFGFGFCYPFLLFIVKVVKLIF